MAVNVVAVKHTNKQSPTLKVHLAESWDEEDDRVQRQQYILMLHQRSNKKKTLYVQKQTIYSFQFNSLQLLHHNTQNQLWMKMA